MSAIRSLLARFRRQLTSAIATLTGTQRTSAYQVEYEGLILCDMGSLAELTAPEARSILLEGDAKFATPVGGSRDLKSDPRPTEFAPGRREIANVAVSTNDTVAASSQDIIRRAAARQWAPFDGIWPCHITGLELWRKGPVARLERPQQILKLSLALRRRLGSRDLG